jgi:predicted porin
MMKKTTIALPLAMLAFGANSAELSAGKDTKFEVNVDVGAYYLTKKTKAGETEKEFLGKGLNQIEIKASHKLSNGYTLLGEIEVDYDPIVDNDKVQTDDVRLGFTTPSGNRLTFGQFDSYLEDNVFEVLGVGRGENGFMTEPSKDNNKGRKIQYFHKIGDLGIAADLTFASSTDKLKSDNGLSFAASYKLGDWTFSAGHSNVAKYNGDAGSSDNGKLNSVKSSTGLAATYKLGNAKLLGLLASEKSTSDIKTSYAGAGITYAWGDLNAGFSAQQRKVGKTKYNEWSAGLGYTVFKGMETYLDLRGLDKPKGEGDIVEVGIRYSF